MLAPRATFYGGVAVVMARKRRSAASRRTRARATCIKWPLPNEPVTLVHAMLAIAFGNAPILARYLRDAKQVNSGVTKLIAFMLDPKVQPSEEPDAEGDRRIDWCRKWRLEFRRTGRGNQKNMAEVDMKLWSIGIFIDTQVRNGMKAEAAKSKAIDEFGISLAQANKALSAARKMLAFKAPTLKQGLRSFIEKTR
jgi:hypothetical protein